MFQNKKPRHVRAQGRPGLHGWRIKKSIRIPIVTQRVNPKRRSPGAGRSKATGAPANQPSVVPVRTATPGRDHWLAAKPLALCVVPKRRSPTQGTKPGFQISLLRGTTDMPREATNCQSIMEFHKCSKSERASTVARTFHMSVEADRRGSAPTNAGRLGGD
jgi:hypothetical protein